eukprot:2573101-Pyramimonas_sp.AAC.1
MHCPLLTNRRASSSTPPPIPPSRITREEAGDHAHGPHECHPWCGRSRTVLVVGVAADSSINFADPARHVGGRGAGNLHNGGFVGYT